MLWTTELYKSDQFTPIGMSWSLHVSCEGGAMQLNNRGDQFSLCDIFTEPRHVVTRLYAA